MALLALVGEGIELVAVELVVFVVVVVVVVGFVVVVVVLAAPGKH